MVSFFEKNNMLKNLYNNDYKKKEKIEKHFYFCVQPMKGEKPNLLANLFLTN
jgi:hypothetical protein